MFQRGWFLVDVPDEGSAQAIVEVIQHYGVTRAMRLEADPARTALLSKPGRVAGCVLLIDVEGANRLLELRASMPTLPILALSRDLTWDLINSSQRLGIELAQWPVPTPNLVTFVQRALSASFLPHDGVARVVSELAQARELSAREVQILTYSLGNEPRNRVRRRLGITENTLKTQIRSLLRKCDERSVDALAKNVLRAALLSKREPDEAVSPWRPGLGRPRTGRLRPAASERLAKSA